MKNKFIVPKVKFEDLDKDGRALVLGIVRGFCKDPVDNSGLNLYSFASACLGEGLEKTEEIVIELLDKGFLRILDNGKGFGMLLWNGKRYKRI